MLNQARSPFVQTQCFCHASRYMPIALYSVYTYNGHVKCGTGLINYCYACLMTPSLSIVISSDVASRVLIIAWRPASRIQSNRCEVEVTFSFTLVSNGQSSVGFVCLYSIFLGIALESMLAYDIACYNIAHTE